MSSEVLGPRRNTSIAVVMSGAIVGGVASYLLLTPQGRRLGRNIGEALVDFSYEWPRLSQAARHVQAAAFESWTVLQGGSSRRERFPELANNL